ncbi:MAG TPA: PDZ domain-containing protein [Planctomycetes bacterium]|nr:PDZ domain-containing protein [Planctomycetota bacterium]
MVNEKLLRLLLSSVGLLALGGFGFQIKDFMVNRDVLMRPVDINRLENTFGRLDSSQLGGHLLSFENYKVLQDLNVTGYVAPPPVVNIDEDVTVRQVIAADDFVVPFIQYPSGAWIQAVGEVVSGDEFPGDFYAVGDKFELSTKPGVKLRLASLQKGAVEIVLVEGDASVSVPVSTYEVDSSQIIVQGPDGALVHADDVVVPQRTRMTEPNHYSIGAADAAEINNMSQEQVLASIPVRTERDPFTNKVKGLRIRSVQPNSVFARMGVQADDIVLEVNGVTAADRQELFDSLQNLSGGSVEVKIERMGGIRTLFFTLP